MLTNTETHYQFHYSTVDQNIRGKTIAVLGDAAGMGKVAAALLASEGAPVFVAARTQEELGGVLAAVAQAGGEADGLVVNLNRPEEFQRFFSQARAWLGRIDAVVSFLSLEEDAGESWQARQNLCTEEAMQQMQAGSQGQIIQVGLGRSQRTGQYNPTKPNPAINLRREARRRGIRVTHIEPDGVSDVSEPLDPEDVAYCVFNSLAQPFGMDVIYLQGQFGD